MTGVQTCALPILYAENGRVVPGVEPLHDEEQVRQFLLNSDQYPLFAKPNDSFRSQGAMSITGPNRDQSLVKFQNGMEIALPDLTTKIRKWGTFLFQENLRSHADLEDIAGNSLSTIRVAILYNDNKPALFRLVWKIPAGGNIADNFWRPGNLVGHVDPKNGKVYALIQSLDDGFVELDGGSELGQRFLSSSPPMFDQAMDLALSASRAFPMFAFQAWDIALSSRGPMALELNHNGDFELLQVGARFGMLDGEFRALLKQNNIRLRNPRRQLLRH